MGLNPLHLCNVFCSGKGQQVKNSQITHEILWIWVVCISKLIQNTLCDVHLEDMFFGFSHLPPRAIKCLMCSLVLLFTRKMDLSNIHPRIYHHRCFHLIIFHPTSKSSSKKNSQKCDISLILFLATSTKKPFPIPSMYGIFTYIYHKDQPNVGKYAIHGWHGFGKIKHIPVFSSSPRILSISHLRRLRGQREQKKVGKHVGNTVSIGKIHPHWVLVKTLVHSE